jgi:carotenoid cleavage dioxygenase-like enzyme
MGEFGRDLTGFIKAMYVQSSLAEAAGLGKLHSYTANNNAVMFRDRFFCLHEAGLPFEAFLSDEGGIVGVKGYESFDGFFDDIPIAAHSAICPETGNFLVHSHLRKGPLLVAEISALTGKVISHYSEKEEESGKRSLFPKDVSLTHEVLFTKNWRVVFDTSLRMDPGNIVKLQNKDGGTLFRWDGQRNLRIGLVPRHKEEPTDDDVKWLDTGSTGFIFHPMNAWEQDDGTILFWAPVSNCFHLEIYADDTSGNKGEPDLPFLMNEYRIDPTTGAVQRTVVDEDIEVESPKIHGEYSGRSCRYGFSGVATKDPSLIGTFTGYTVWDLENKIRIKTMHLEDGEYGSDPILIPKAGSSPKQAGDDFSNHVYLGTYTHNVHEDRSYFVLFDGQTGSSVPVVRIRMPYRIPFGFHGLWIEGNDLIKHIAATKQRLAM